MSNFKVRIQRSGSKLGGWYVFKCKSDLTGMIKRHINKTYKPGTYHIQTWKLVSNVTTEELKNIPNEWLSLVEPHWKFKYQKGVEKEEMKNELY